MNAFRGIHPSGHRRSSDVQIWFHTNLWESRYTSIALLDSSAVLACMAYVDLNPIRAGIVETLQDSMHTSIKKRIDDVEINKHRLTNTMQPVAQSVNGRPIHIQLSDYIEPVEWTGKNIVHPNKASMPQPIQSIIQSLNLQPDNWLTQITQLNKSNCIAIGSLQHLKNKAVTLKKNWIKGFSSVRLLYAN